VLAASDEAAILYHSHASVRATFNAIFQHTKPVRHAGHAVLEMLAQPVVLSDKEDDISSGMSSSGTLVNISPVEEGALHAAQEAEGSGPSIGSHPVAPASLANDPELVTHEERKPKVTFTVTQSFRQVVNVRSSHPIDRRFVTLLVFVLYRSIDIYIT
jgi:hypothetical protein